MANKGESEKAIIGAAMSRGKNCLSAEQLERLAAAPEQAGAQELARHVESCGYCKTELHLLKVFQSGEGSAEDIRQVSARLHARSGEIFPAPGREPWWRFSTRWLSPAAVAMAGVLVVAGIVVQMRHNSPPALDPANSSREVLRSSSLAIGSPSGDLEAPPKEVRWESSTSAVRYEVRIVEVDGTEIWKAQTVANHVDLPPDVQARVVPGKTLIWQVSAFDASGRKVAESERARFRLLQRFHSR